MAITDIFSKRNKPLPDTYVYDQLPNKLRAQVVHLLEEALGHDFAGMDDGWKYLARSIAREHGLLDIPASPHHRYDGRDWYTDCLNYVLQAEPEQALDMIEIAFRVVENAITSDDYRVQRRLGPGKAAEALSELNHRFRENGCGYQFENGCVVRVDSHLLHANTVRPALALLRTKGFAGPNQEFLAAHEHYRHGRIEAAITEACKAFESTMKAICDARKWKYDKTATAGALIKILIDKKLIATYSEEQLRAVEKCLLGIATIRNKNSGHGTGAKPRDLPDHMAAYALHLAASNIVFLVETHRST